MEGLTKKTFLTFCPLTVNIIKKQIISSEIFILFFNKFIFFFNKKKKLKGYLEGKIIRYF